MARVKRGTTTKARHKRVLARSKGYFGRRKNTIRVARQAVERAEQYRYRDRKRRKRDFRRLWIQRINAAARLHGLRYGQLMEGLSLLDARVNRKVLAELAVESPQQFADLVAQASARRESSSESAPQS